MAVLKGRAGSSVQASSQYVLVRTELSRNSSNIKKTYSTSHRNESCGVTKKGNRPIVPSRNEKARKSILYRESRTLTKTSSPTRWEAYLVVFDDMLGDKDEDKIKLWFTRKGHHRNASPRDVYFAESVSKELNVANDQSERPLSDRLPESTR